MKSRSLERIRAELGNLDGEILRMLNQRARLSMEVGQVKREEGIDVYDPSQEVRVFSRLRETNEGPLPSAAVHAIFREIVSSSRALQAPVSVSYLGPEASFTHQAAISHFGRGAALAPVQTIPEVFEQVERGDTSWAVVPVENSTEGSVRQTLDRLVTTSMSIRAEIHLRISHCLLSASPGKEHVKKIYSHPHAFAQCRRWLGAQLSQCALEAAESTAAAARKALKEPGTGAIAGSIAAEQYGLEILAQGIEDHPENTTRFLVLGKGESEATGKDKTTILFATRHEPGALFMALEPLAGSGVNIMSIESRPAQDRMWEYLFFLDLEGHKDEKRIADCLRDMAARTSFVRNLGSYPKGEVH
ncbi:MAG: prephenate dehydratase [Desulfobacteraceae bacterium]|nr:MAG: prephenate dehydratase [Desulfobacteraceae bacterium]